MKNDIAKAYISKMYPNGICTSTQNVMIGSIAITSKKEKEDKAREKDRKRKLYGSFW